jgi:uncharacterized membrane protein YedE/YeeE
VAERNGEAQLRSWLTIGDPLNYDVTLVAIVGDDSTRMYMLLFGMAAFAGGILLMFRHQRSFREASRKTTNERLRLFELRKFRRRMTASSMIAAIGVMLASLYWADDPRVFAILITLVLVTLLGVLGLACLDLFSVGLQQLAHPDDSARQAMVDEYLRLRKEPNGEAEQGDEPSSSSS